MENMQRDLEAYRITPTLPRSLDWAAEFNASLLTRMTVPQEKSNLGGTVQPRFSPSEFYRFQQMEKNSASRLSTLYPRSLLNTTGYQRPLQMSYGTNMGIMGIPHQQLPQAPVNNLDPHVLHHSKGKERMVELDDKDWEKQFADIDQARQVDLDAEANKAMEKELNDLDTSLNDLDMSILSETNQFGDFESIWRGIGAEKAAAGGIFDADSPNYDTSYPGISPAWDRANIFEEGYHDPQLGNYLFERENPFSTARDPYDEGLKIMNSGGNLSLAALAFEAAVQQDPQHIEAWCMLGNAQAQNEKETPAIRALEQAIKIDPSNLTALMGLAIAYTNENYDTTAYRTLERWLSVKYPQIIAPEDVTQDSEIGFSERQQIHEKVTNFFIRAAQLSPQGDHMDPDVQVGLGVLFYGGEDHEKAVDCFEAALASHESGASNQPGQAHLLWNRLGATLANSGRSEEAIAAYEKALTLHPNFVRARYNLGVSCINIGCFDEAAQHLLYALSMHDLVEREGLARVKEIIGDNGNGNANDPPALAPDDVERLVGMNQSTNLLETLRRVFGSMGRKDLAEKVHVGMDLDSFRGEFDF